MVFYISLKLSSYLNFKIFKLSRHLMRVRMPQGGVSAGEQVSHWQVCAEEQRSPDLINIMSILTYTTKRLLPGTYSAL
jgi:hypothetical protein